MRQIDISGSNHPLALLRRGVGSAATAMKEASAEDVDSSRKTSRRSLLKTGAGLVAVSLLEPLFKIVEANDKVPGEHHFTPQNIAKLKINSTNGILALAAKQGYLPRETEDSKFSYSKFKDMADRASVRDLRQYFRAIEMLRNDGYFDSNKKMEEVHEILSNTPDIAPVHRLLLITLGARSKDGSEIVHNLTHSEFSSILNDFLPNNFDFPYQNDKTSNVMLDKFTEAVSRYGAVSVTNRGLTAKARAIRATY